MKLLFFSDIHGIKKNLSKLEKLIKKETFDKIIVLGDLYNRGLPYDKKGIFDNQKVHDFLKKYKDNLIVTKGNCDSNIKENDFLIQDDIVSLKVDGLNFYLTHGNYYNYYKTEEFDKRGILIYGHEHIPYIRKREKMIYICVGSISLPRNDLGATYMIYENKKFTIYHIDGEIIDEYEIKEEKK